MVQWEYGQELPENYWYNLMVSIWMILMTIRLKERCCSTFPWYTEAIFNTFMLIR